MSSRNRIRRDFHLENISDALRELYDIDELKEPQEIISAYREFVPRLLDFVRQTEDMKLTDVAERFSNLEEQARQFYDIETLQEKLNDLRKTIERFPNSIPPEAAEGLLACIHRFEDSLANRRELALSSFQSFNAAKQQLTHELIGRRLEKEIAPDLAKKLGFLPCPNIIPDDGEEVEVDFLGEKNLTTSPFGTGRLKRKTILIIETTATIAQNDIHRFSKKLVIINDKYQRHAKLFGYDLIIEAWMFACYGWTDEFIKLATANGIKSFAEEQIIEILKENGLLDRRIPICP
jgi:hypothetical protein